VIPWAATICLLLRSLALKKSVALVVPVAMIAVVPVLVLIVPLHVVHVAPWALTQPQPMAATSPQKHLVLMLNPPLSAFEKSPRQLQQLTVKENNHVATRSPEIPQRAKRP
jgi:hypothetical protein